MTRPPPQRYRDNAPAPEPARPAGPDVAAQRALAVARQEARVVALEAERARYESLCTSGVSPWSRLAVVLALPLFLALQMATENGPGSRPPFVVLLVGSLVFSFVMDRLAMGLCRRVYRAPMARLDQRLADARARLRERVLVAALPLDPEPRLRVAPVATADPRDATLDEEALEPPGARYADRR